MSKSSRNGLLSDPKFDTAENADRSQAGPLGRGHEMSGQKIVRPLRLGAVSKLELPQLVVLRPGCGSRRGQQRGSRQCGDRFASIHAPNNILSSGGMSSFLLVGGSLCYPCRPDKGGGGQMNSSKEEGTRWGVGETPRNQDFPVLPCPEETELAPGWAAELAREGKDEENGFNGGRRV